MAEGYTNSWGYLLVFLDIRPFYHPHSRHQVTTREKQPAGDDLLDGLAVSDALLRSVLVMPELGPHFTMGLPDRNSDGQLTGLEAKVPIGRWLFLDSQTRHFAFVLPNKRYRIFPR